MRGEGKREAQALFKFLGHVKIARGNRENDEYPLSVPASRLYEFIFVDKRGRKRDSAPASLPLSLSPPLLPLSHSLAVSSTSFTEKPTSLYPTSRGIMRDLRRYVSLMELKCAKRHVKSGGLYRLETARAQRHGFIAHRSVRGCMRPLSR